MSDANARSRGVLIAFAAGQWLMFATSLFLIFQPIVSGFSSTTTHTDDVPTVLIVLSLAFAWNFRWLRGARVSLAGAVLWIVVAWSAIAFEALR